MVMASLIALQLATATPALPPPFTELPPQVLEPGQCALFLWDRASGRRIAMLSRTPLQLRAIIDGRSTDLPVAASEGEAVLGFAPVSRFRSASRSFEVRLTILPATVGGAVVRDGSLTITEADGSAVVLPVAGLAGCPQ
ncbi:hypothetical protein [Sandarakinorhabdus oryzae]|uniref:hypothetical protein n=1 Tax=Sandarakinorhabdus oryzae TaxID=2675220 RepID=UPI0012E136EF|nr:hypothetical protein [Sandarakinorhabdus oryzae]